MTSDEIGESFKILLPFGPRVGYLPNGDYSIVIPGEEHGEFILEAYENLSEFRDCLIELINLTGKIHSLRRSNNAS
jgi:hypothetical protein